MPAHHRQRRRRGPGSWLASLGLALPLAAQSADGPADAAQTVSAAIPPAAAAGSEQIGGDPAGTPPGLPDDTTPLGTLGPIRIERQDVFPDDSRAWLKRLANATHWTSREQTVRNEIWFKPGEVLTEAKLRELERNLRATGLYAEARASVRPTAEPGVLELVVETRDRLSLLAGAAGSTVGDVGSVSAGITESNFLGKGDRLGIDYRENTEGEFAGGVSYRDRYVFDRFLRFDARAATTEEGDQLRLRLERPLQHLRDRWSWRAEVSSFDTIVDYFEGGDAVVEVPEAVEDLAFGLQRAYGPPDKRLRLGLSTRYTDRRYGPAEGPQAGSIEVPGDTRGLFVGPLVGFDRAKAFNRETNLDTLGFVQDLRLGYAFELLVGGLYRDEEGAEQGLQPQAFLETNFSAQPWRGSYLTATAGGSLRSDGSEAVGWLADASVHGYLLLPKGHTLASSLTFDQAFESQDLPIELTLGVDNGLRGYPTREFAGERRFQLNLEDRWDTGLDFAEFNLGLVGFYDAGLIAELDQEFGPLLHAVGFGLRLGSPSILGSTVLRMDVGFPLYEPDGADYGPTISLGTGQVFSFFGRQAALATR